MSGSAHRCPEADRQKATRSGPSGPRRRATGIATIAVIPTETYLLRNPIPSDQGSSGAHSGCSVQDVALGAHHRGSGFRPSTTVTRLKPMVISSAEPSL